MARSNLKHTLSLFRQAQARDRASLNALMRRHERLVHAVVRQQWNGG